MRFLATCTIHTSFGLAVSPANCPPTRCQFLEHLPSKGLAFDSQPPAQVTVEQVVLLASQWHQESGQ